MNNVADTRPTIVFDFDGVIHRYSKGWYDGSIYDVPTKGIQELLRILKPLYKIVVLSTRCSSPKGMKDIKAYLRKYDIYVDEVTAEKVPAIAYVDDRAINFNGNCNKLLNDIMQFKPWIETHTRFCKYCHSKFFVDDTRYGVAKYCSDKCKEKAYLEKIEEYNDKKYKVMTSSTDEKEAEKMEEIGKNFDENYTIKFK